MDMIRGTVVRAKAGRDKDDFFVIVNVLDDAYVMIANGKSRKLSSPKRKNIKHLMKTNTVVDITTDRKLRNDLKVFKTEAI